MPNLESSLQIEPATPADVPVILQLIRELAEFERLLDQVTATEQQLREGLFGPKPSAEVIVARLQPSGEVIGFALFFHNFSTFLAKPGIYLEDLYVRQKHRGQGYGEALLRRLARLAVERKCGRLEWSVLDWNHRAIDFYKSLGAVPMDEWTLYRVTGAALERLGGSAAIDPANGSDRK
ncbi:MAG: GNAT family N-acetyltransferase [Steroidobacter sp.]